MHPRQSPTTHTEQLGDEVAVYDRARAEVHALNPTAACVWRRCDGATSPDAIAAALRREMGIPEADAVVDLTLRQLARVHLLELPIASRGDRPATTRRWLLGRGLTAAMLPAVYSIVAPSPVDAQSVPPPAAPTLTGLSPNQGTPGTTVPVTLTGTNFVVGATTVTVNSGGVTATNVIVGSTTSLTADIVINLAAVTGAHSVTVTTAGGTSGAQTFTVALPAPGSMTFNFTGDVQTFPVPAGVVSLSIVATGAQGGVGLSVGLVAGGAGGLGGRATATVPVTPGASLTVRVGGVGFNGLELIATPGGFNDGGGSAANGGGGGGSSSVRDGATPLVVAGGGGGGGGSDIGVGANGGAGGAGGGLLAVSGQIPGGTGGGGGGQITGGNGGFRAAASNGNNGSAGTADQGGDGGEEFGEVGGGGGGGGYRGGGGGGAGAQINNLGGGGGGGGSSFAAVTATAVVHDQGFNNGDGSVTISW